MPPSSPRSRPVPARWLASACARPACRGVRQHIVTFADAFQELCPRCGTWGQRYPRAPAAAWSPPPAAEAWPPYTGYDWRAAARARLVTLIAQAEAARAAPPAVRATARARAERLATALLAAGHRRADLPPLPWPHRLRTWH